MIHVQVTSDQAPKALADLIASTQGEESLDPKLAIEASLIRDHQLQAERERPSRGEIDTVDFTKLDADNDWTRPVVFRPSACSRRTSRVDNGAHGGRSSIGRAPGCGPGCRGFDPRRSPQSYGWLSRARFRCGFSLPRGCHGRAEDRADRIPLLVLVHVDIAKRRRDVGVAHQRLKHRQRHPLRHDCTERVPQAVGRLGRPSHSGANVQHVHRFAEPFVGHRLAICLRDHPQAPVRQLVEHRSKPRRERYRPHLVVLRRRDLVGELVERTPNGQLTVLDVAPLQTSDLRRPQPCFGCQQITAR